MRIHNNIQLWKQIVSYILNAIKHHPIVIAVKEKKIGADKVNIIQPPFLSIPKVFSYSTKV